MISMDLLALLAMLTLILVVLAMYWLPSIVGYYRRRLAGLALHGTARARAGPQQATGQLTPCGAVSARWSLAWRRAAPPWC